MKTKSRKTTTIQLRATDDEVATWKADADLAGMTLSDWIRGRLGLELIQREERHVQERRVASLPPTARQVIAGVVSRPEPASQPWTCRAVVNRKACLTRNIAGECIEALFPCPDEASEADRQRRKVGARLVAQAFSDLRRLAKSGG